MSYAVVVPAPVQRQLDRLPAAVVERLAPHIAALANNPRPHGCEKLAGSVREYRIRVGDYRVRYEVFDDEALLVLTGCGHRRDVYRR